MGRPGANLSGRAYSMQNTHFTAPYESSSLATSRGQDVTGLAFCCLSHDKHSAELAAFGGLPPFGALRHHLPPAERWDNNPCFA